MSDITDALKELMFQVTHITGDAWPLVDAIEKLIDLKIKEVTTTQGDTK